MKFILNLYFIHKNINVIIIIVHKKSHDVRLKKQRRKNDDDMGKSERIVNDIRKVNEGKVNE